MSKELEALKEIKWFCYKEGKLDKQFDIIKTALKEYELMKEIRITARFDLAQVNKEHKALEIIKEKRVNVDLLYYCLKLDDYNNNARIPLTQEEYDILKEVLV